MSRSSCPLCESSDLYTFFEKPRVPLDVGMVWGSAEEALAAPFGAIRLARCVHCRFIFNRDFEPGRVAYEPGFEASLHHSASHCSYLRKTARDLAARYQLAGKTVAEVGCGSGFFLRMLSEEGNCRGIGFDPSMSNEQARRSNDKVSMVPAFFNTESASDFNLDFICCRSVLEHIHEPIPFLRQIGQAVNGKHLPVYFDLADGDYVFKSSFWWNVFYEQCCYYSPLTLKFAFEKAGFRVTNVGRCFNDNYLSVEATTNRNVEPENPAMQGADDPLQAFSEGYRRTVLHWEQRLDDWRRQNKKAVVWGSGGRGVSFLNELPIDDVIPYVVDVNPERQGSYISGKAVQIVPPEFLVQVRPDLIVITNPVYESEIAEMVAQLKLNAELVLA